MREKFKVAHLSIDVACYIRTSKLNHDVTVYVKIDDKGSKLKNLKVYRRVRRDVINIIRVKRQYMVPAIP